MAGAEALGSWAPDCPQPSGSTSRAGTQSEDCLFLNVWTPTTDREARLPVMVWFYGGSFLFGSASDPICDGAALATRGAVVVTANYRVGIFGYLAHPALTAESAQGSSGNYGLLDNLAALRWVADHIADHGGDPENITAFGVSAGSASLALLQTSPLAGASFHRLILQSPGAFRPLASLVEAEQAGLDAYGPDLDTMRAWSADEALRRTSALVPQVRGLTSPRLLRPIRDGWVVPEDDRLSYRHGRFHPVPTLVGGNADEGGKLTAGWPISDVGAYRSLIEANFGSFADEALSLYRASTDGEVAHALAEVFGDTQFTYGARGIAQALATRQPATYRYLYSATEEAGSTAPPGHGDEVGPLFAGAPPQGAAMADAWLRFAASGDPNDGTPDWLPYQRDNYLDIGRTLSMQHDWRTEQLDFLDRFFERAINDRDR